MSAKNRILANIENKTPSFLVFNELFVCDGLLNINYHQSAFYAFSIRYKNEYELQLLTDKTDDVYEIQNLIEPYYIDNLSWVVNFAIDVIRLYYYFKELSLKNKTFYLQVRKLAYFYYIEYNADTNSFGKNKATMQIKFNQNEVPSYGP